MAAANASKSEVSVRDAAGPRVGSAREFCSRYPAGAVTSHKLRGARRQAMPRARLTRRFAMSLGIFSHLLWGWWVTGHVQTTMWAVSAAIGILEAKGLLHRMGTGVSRMKAHLSGLWLMNVCQDIDEGNILGKCGIEVPGGQVAHFMADTGQPKAEAYDKAYARIRKETFEAWEWFRKGFPENKPQHHHGGVLGVLEKVAEYNPVTLAYKGVKEVVEETEILNAQKHMARALHTLQDSFSPAHTLRDVQSLVIQEIFPWDPYNKDEHDNDRYYGGHWAGHAAMDKPEHSDLTKYLEYKAYEASRDLTVAVLSNLYTDRGYFVSALKDVLWRYLKKAW
jgi:hypothetical protein